MENRKKQNLCLTLGGMIVILAGILVTILGYKLNRDGEITAKDTAVFVGYFLVMAGILLLSNGITRRIAFAALFAALSYIGFQYFRFDLTVGSEKTAFHLGNTFVVLAALFLGGMTGGLAGAVGLTLADFTSGYVTSAPKTFFLKLCIGLIVGFIAHTIFHISRAQSAKKNMRAALVASICGMAFNIVADPLVGYFYKKYLFGLPQDIANTLAKLSSLTTAVNAVLSVAAAVLLYGALRPALEKSGLFFRKA